MRGLRSILCGVAALILLSAGDRTALAAGLEPESLAQLAAGVTPAVVAITSALPSAAGDSLLDRGSARIPGNDPKYSLALGSGFIIDPSGYIVTNNHVIAGAGQIQVTLRGGKSYFAEIVGTDRKTDLALLKVDSARPLPFVSFGDSDAAEVGDRIVAIGNPFGLGGTVTTGIISALDRDLHAGPFDDYLQIDAAINPGNSGGPSFNLRGEVIGVNTAIASPNGGSVGIGFAIPANMAKPIIRELRLHGQILRGWIGVSVQDVTPEIADSLELDAPQGALLASVQPGGPAALAGLRRGDVILSFDGHQVATSRELPRMVADEQTGRLVTVVVWHSGARATVAVTIGLAKDKPAAIASAGTPIADGAGRILHGVQLTALTGAVRRKLDLSDDTHGVVILSLAGDSVLAREGLRRADIIEQVEQQDVGKPSEVDHLIRQARARGRATVLFLVSRGGNERYLAVKAVDDKYAQDLLPYHPLAQGA
jgi:serine protease Do